MLKSAKGASWGWKVKSRHPLGHGMVMFLKHFTEEMWHQTQDVFFTVWFTLQPQPEGDEAVSRMRGQRGKLLNFIKESGLWKSLLTFHSARLVSLCQCLARHESFCEVEANPEGLVLFFNPPGIKNLSKYTTVFLQGVKIPSFCCLKGSASSCGL